jgi:hypothetical protein
MNLFLHYCIQIMLGSFILSLLFMLIWNNTVVQLTGFNQANFWQSFQICFFISMVTLDLKELN